MKNNGYYWIYILECDNGHYYTGHTDDLKRRYSEHLDGSSRSKYTRSFKPVKIAQCWKLFNTRGMALKVEHFIKSFDRKSKMDLVDNPGRLKTGIFEKLNLDLEISEFDPSAFE